MNPETFINNFGHIAHAPGGIDILRGLVLDLAMRGRLVEQDIKDTPAALAIASAEAGRATWVEQTAPAKYGRKESGYPLGEEDLPFGWTYCRLGEVFQFINGRAYKKTEWKTAGTPVIRIQNLNGGDDYYYSDLDLKPHNYCATGDLLFAWSASFGPYLWMGERAIFHYHIWKVVTSPAVERRFAFHLLAALTEAVKSASHGLAMLHMTKEAMEGLVCPIPPVAEQKRIVERIDQLLLLCEELGSRKQQLHFVSTRFRKSALHSLTEAQDVGELFRAWERISTNWSTVTDHPGCIDDIRDTVRQLAVEGRLVPQNPDDEPALAILQACQRRKHALLEGGGVRRRAELPIMSGEELSYAIPPGWVVAPLDDWCDIGGGVAKGRKLGNRKTVALPYLRVANVKAGYLLLDEVKTIDVAVDEVARYSLRSGDVLLTEGGDWDKLGRSAIWTGEIDPCLHQNHVFRARPLTDEVLPEWISLFTNSEEGRRYFQSKAKRTTNLASINMTELRSTPLPVPPVQEQRRILLRLQEIEALLARLQVALVSAGNECDRFAAAIARAG
ncbi:hypothetical protein A5624_06140 [Mycobacterium sp. 1482292.6]|uniref:restriction endonuclease subunit S n=1 Tax=Mycobacterium sp. 1482292.6 TaxID=1834081 RepID=UPI0007FB825C|nr:restriction endonuclease subunit S [Mycobacterium sp. 1482292.6]OBJ02151.1 hypothetical protein A5624_06140 [Mycobacterium sp. 1482292.6]